jgi:hypothetical protein
MLAKEIGGRIAKLGEKLAELAKKLGHAGDDLATASHQAAGSMETASGAFTREASDAATSAQHAAPTPLPAPEPGSRAELQQSYGAFMQRGVDHTPAGGAYSYIQQRLNPGLAGVDDDASRLDDVLDSVGHGNATASNITQALNPEPDEQGQPPGDGEYGTDAQR